MYAYFIGWFSEPAVFCGWSVGMMFIGIYVTKYMDSHYRKYNEKVKIYIHDILESLGSKVTYLSFIDEAKRRHSKATIINNQLLAECEEYANSFIIQKDKNEAN